MVADYFLSSKYYANNTLRQKMKNKQINEIDKMQLHFLKQLIIEKLSDAHYYTLLFKTHPQRFDKCMLWMGCHALGMTPPSRGWFGKSCDSPSPWVCSRPVRPPASCRWPECPACVSLWTVPLEHCCRRRSVCLSASASSGTSLQLQR
jgi:hypothetical protein